MADSLEAIYSGRAFRLDQPRRLLQEMAICHGRTRRVARAGGPVGVCGKPTGHAVGNRRPESALAQWYLSPSAGGLVSPHGILGSRAGSAPLYFWE